MSTMITLACSDVRQFRFLMPSMESLTSKTPTSRQLLAAPRVCQMTVIKRVPRAIPRMGELASAPQSSIRRVLSQITKQVGRHTLSVNLFVARNNTRVASMVHVEFKRVRTNARSSGCARIQGVQNPTHEQLGRERGERGVRRSPHASCRERCPPSEKSPSPNPGGVSSPHRKKSVQIGLSPKVAVGMGKANPPPPPPPPCPPKKTTVPWT
jgi:hypothetical protein